jgi:quercetin dioxygenase-like cupin family protein
MKLQIAIATLIAFAAPAFAQHADQHSALPSGFETTPLLKSGKTADGDALQYPKTEKPEIVAVTGTIQPGGRTPLHQHPIPVFVHVMDGELEVQTEGKEPRGYKTGDSFIESMNRSHQVFNKGNSPARILVVFVGEEGKPTTILPK